MGVKVGVTKQIFDEGIVFSNWTWTQ